MIRLAANITLLDWALPMAARPAEAARRGFDGVECLFPYTGPLPDLISAREESGLPMALINTPEPRWAEGARGCAAIPGESAAFRAGFDEALICARSLGCGTIHVMAGVTQEDGAFETFVTNLRAASDSAPALTLTIEPLNAQDAPGYFLNDYDLAARVLDVVERPNVALQFDSWHAARIHGDARAVWARHAPRVRHVQISGAEARGAPDMSADAERGLLEDIVRSGYSGWISAEFIPQPGDDPDWLCLMRAVLDGVLELREG